MSNQKGIAMVMMLFVSAIMAIITLNFIKQSSHQLKIAQRLQDKTKAFNNVQNAKAEVFFKLLTRPIRELENEGWKFYNESFFIENSDVKIQDLRGLFSLYGFIAPSTMENLLRLCGVKQVDVSTVASKVLLKHDGKSIMPIDRLQRLEMFTEKENHKTKICLNKNITRHNVGNFNPSLAPKESLVARMGEITAEEFLKVRGAGVDALNTVFEKYLLDDSLNSYSVIAGPYFRVILRSQVGESVWTEQIEFKIKLSTPHEPIMFLSHQMSENE
ncbi:MULTISPECIES: hypothetical protein [Pseudoalteromonas]|uniref:hypothetical protein n=1 Tax=Pseudoalteromonas TaxID=53246 RepID=UPI001583FF36|nr:MULTISPECIES: hypothetical protein [Pseudoalteromonas]MDI4652081.1 hypothetical protein [Pseudoalteromonas shioyasakiensis]NUJ38406.1 hypothetical protein [Pseudoalteromonas sp. 0303]